MSSIGSQSFIHELQILLEILKKEKHPAVYKLLPYCQDQYLRELKDFSATLNCIRQELLGLQSSIQNLTMLVVAQQQQLNHPSSCGQFSLQTISPQQHLMSPATLASLVPPPPPPPPLPPPPFQSLNMPLVKRQTKARKPRKKPNISQGTEAAQLASTGSNNNNMENHFSNLDDLVREYCGGGGGGGVSVEPVNVDAIDVSLFN